MTLNYLNTRRTIIYTRRDTPTGLIKTVNRKHTPKKTRTLHGILNNNKNYSQKMIVCTPRKNKTRLFKHNFPRSPRWLINSLTVEMTWIKRQKKNKERGILSKTQVRDSRHQISVFMETHHEYNLVPVGYFFFSHNSHRMGFMRFLCCFWCERFTYTIVSHLCALFGF